MVSLYVRQAFNASIFLELKIIRENNWAHSLFYASLMRSRPFGEKKGKTGGVLVRSTKDIMTKLVRSCDLIISYIPDEAITILDVGCGVGRLALNLIESGYRVDCVSPNSVLTEYTRNLLGDKSFIFECCFEKIQTEKRDF